MAQPAHMGVEFVDWLKGAVDPSGDHCRHSFFRWRVADISEIVQGLKD
jgi:hypothetical protein